MNKISRARLIVTILTALCNAVLLPIATNLATSNLPEWIQPYTWLAWPALIVLVPITIGLFISELKSNQPVADNRDAELSNRNRHRILEKVRHDWIDDYLKYSL